ncbi:hypothetical protein [Polaromonas sp.]|uniref:hypothetical protein n=1 Tax=Polaromonas sp. TaxID=1869339 RepID=UPI0017A328A4|nr:hypothetical protein [Polaromonas sp.]NMM06011.1 hypothetical protein [Polaromonas sp.]
MLQAAEEVLATLAKTKPEAGLVKRAIAVIRAWLREHIPAFKNLAMTDDEIITRFILPARKHIEGGGPEPQGGQPVPAFNRTNTSAQNALQALSENDKLFALAKSVQDTVEGIASDTDSAIKVNKEKDPVGRTVYTFTMPDGKTATMSVRPFNAYATGEAPTLYGYTLKDGEMSGLVTQRPGENPEDVGPTDDVWIDVSRLNTGDDGTKIYNIAETYAHNTERLFIGDPAGLSDEALRRRTEQMLSSALKFGTTSHLAPHPRQVEGDTAMGVPPLKWTYGDDIGNIEALIHTSLASYNHVNPLTFEPRTGRFVDSEGHELDEDAIRQIADTGPGRAAGAGGKTLQRGAIFNALVQEGRGASSSNGAGGGSGILEGLVEFALQHGASTNKVFYSRGGTNTSGTDGLAFSRTPAADSAGADPAPRATLAKYTR